MPTASRPVKVACLACRASKIRCNGQMPCATCSIHHEECRYQPSRRGGARRGTAAADELAKKRARQLTDKDRNVHRPNDHHTSDAALLSSLLSSTEPDLQPSRNALDNCSISFPSPLGETTDLQDISRTVEPPKRSIRAYRCDQDLINAYYIFIHPYFPLLPPPAAAQYEDQCVAVKTYSSYLNASMMPYWPVSPLGLALMAIMALLPVPDDSLTTDTESAQLRRSYADLYARSALESVEDSINLSSHVEPAKGPQSTLHPAVPREIEPVLTLGLLSLFEYCQHGNIPKMRIRANLALTMAMDRSLHEESSQTGYLDAQRRCWWATMFLAYQSSIMNALPPIITIGDVRITTPFPEFRGCREPWPLLVNAQEALRRSCGIGRQLIRENGSNMLPRSLREDILTLDSFIFQLAAEADRFRCVTNYQGAEADASRNLWAISNALIHTARLTLHRVRAFLDRPLFLAEDYDYLAIDTVQEPQQTRHLYLSTGRKTEIDTVFPFTTQQSVTICFHSSLVVSRVFRRLPSPNPMYSDATDVEIAVHWASRRPLASPRSMPYMASCQLQSFWVLATVLWRVHTAMCSGNLASYSYLFDRPSGTTQVQDAERLIDELQSGMEALGKSIQADVVFGGVAPMAKEVQRVYESTAMG